MELGVEKVGRQHWKFIGCEDEAALLVWGNVVLRYSSKVAVALLFSSKAIVGRSSSLLADLFLNSSQSAPI